MEKDQATSSKNEPPQQTFLPVKMPAPHTVDDLPGQPLAVYLSDESQVAISMLMQQHNLSASSVIDTLIRCSAKLPLREINKWFAEK